MKIPRHPDTSFDENHFVDLLRCSLSLDPLDKDRVVEALPRLNQSQINQLIKILEEERSRFSELESEHPRDMQKLRAQRGLEELEHSRGAFQKPTVSDERRTASNIWKIDAHPNSVFDEDQFKELLAGSISLTMEEKQRIIAAIPRLEQNQIDELLLIFEEEKRKFAELEQEFARDVKLLKDAKEQASRRTRIEIQDFLSPQNEIIIKELAKRPDAMEALDPRKFEILVAEIMRDLGWTVQLTPETRDGGRDLILTSSFKGLPIMAIVECKQFRKRNVDVNVVKNFLYTLREQDRANKGIIATTSGFSSGAIQLAQDYKWQLELHDGDALAEMLASFGTHRETPVISSWAAPGL